MVLALDLFLEFIRAEIYVTPSPRQRGRGIAVGLISRRACIYNGPILSRTIVRQRSERTTPSSASTFPSSKNPTAARFPLESVLRRRRCRTREKENPDGGDDKFSPFAAV